MKLPAFSLFLCLTLLCLAHGQHEHEKHVENEPEAEPEKKEEIVNAIEVVKLPTDTESVTYKIETEDGHHVQGEPESDEENEIKHKEKPHWGYEGAHGPANWGSMYPICNKKRQSPIDIHTHSAVTADLPPLALTYYFSKPKKITLKNNGHTAKLELEAKIRPIMSGGGYLEKYEFLQLHFHWGSDSSKGSEHTIDGHSFPLEMHLVHYNTKYPNVQEILDNQYPDGLGVLGVLFKESKSDNPVLDTLLEGLERIPESGNVTYIKDVFSIGSLLPHNLNDFYMYSGSLTTPSCYEIVTWTVLSDTVPISNSQLNRFRSLRATPTHRLQDNFRPSQEHVGRNVFYRAGAFTITAGFFTIIFSIFFSMMLR